MIISKSEVKKLAKQEDVALFEVWIHSHYETSKPLSVEVFGVNGKVDMEWLNIVLQPESDKLMLELAYEFYNHLGRTETSAWFACRMNTEDLYVDVLGVID